MQAPNDQIAGRADAAAVLRSRLPGASAVYLQAALDNPHLGQAEVLALLLNRRAGAAQLERIARDPRWTRSPAVLRRLALHPATPPAGIRGQLERLGWKDLLEVSVAPTAHATVRRRAELLLTQRLEGLSTGERVALARRAGKVVILRLAESEDARVLGALLGNGRLTEGQVVRLAAASHAPGGFLRRLGEHADWGCRREVRLALARNPRAPVATALRAVEGMSRGDLKRLLNGDKVPRIVRVRAARLLERGARVSPRRPRPPVG